MVDRWQTSAVLSPDRPKAGCFRTGLQSLKADSLINGNQFGKINWLMTGAFGKFHGNTASIC